MTWDIYGQLSQGWNDLKLVVVVMVTFHAIFLFTFYFLGEISSEGLSDEI